MVPVSVVVPVPVWLRAVLLRPAPADDVAALAAEARAGADLEELQGAAAALALGLELNVAWTCVVLPHTQQ